MTSNSHRFEWSQGAVTNTATNKNKMTEVKNRKQEEEELEKYVDTTI